MLVTSVTPSPDAPEVEFRLRTLRTGVYPSIFSCAYSAVYYALTWDQPHRDVLTVLVVLAFISSLAIGRLPLERVIAGRWREPFFVGWSVGLILMIAVGASVDGGTSSPLTALFFLPLVYAALSYPLRSMLIVGAVDLLAYLTLAVLVGGVGAEHAFMFTLALANATWICGWQSRNHEQQRRELARVSRSDALTGTLNRRGFEERFAAEISRARRDGMPLALAVLDLDDFKRVNDTEGHAAGDRLLCTMADTLCSTLRVADTVGRLGGDEFGVLLCGGDAARALERVQEAAAAVAPASIGVAVFPQDGTVEAELHQAADADLYARKDGRPRRGRGGANDLSWASALASAVDRRMAVDHDHGGAVAEYAAGIATLLGWSGADLDDLRLAAMLHDVGKAEVPERILRKPGPLDESEWEQLRRHPVTGAEMLSTIDGMSRVVPWVRHSHERMDGNGYPDGLAGEAIPLAARIMLVADAFDAMTSNRGYRRAMDRADALEELRRCAGSQFDPACVAALERHLAAAV